MLAKAVKVALRDGNEAAARARTDVLRRFSQGRLIADMESLYDSLIAKSQIPNLKLQL